MFPPDERRRLNNGILIAVRLKADYRDIWEGSTGIVRLVTREVKLGQTRSISMDYVDVLFDPDPRQKRTALSFGSRAFVRSDFLKYFEEVAEEPQESLT